MLHQRRHAGQNVVVRETWPTCLTLAGHPILTKCHMVHKSSTQQEKCAPRMFVDGRTIITSSSLICCPRVLSNDFDDDQCPSSSTESQFARLWRACVLCDLSRATDDDSAPTSGPKTRVVEFSLQWPVVIIVRPASDA